MMKFFFLSLITFFPSMLFANDIWERLVNKTWFSEETFAGYQLVFYKTGNGLPKVILQIHGSGLHIIKSEIFDVEIIQDSIFLRNGLDLKTRSKTEELSYAFDKNDNKIIENGKRLKILFDQPVIYNWADRAERGVRVNYEFLFKMSLGKHKIYDMNHIKQYSIIKKR